MAEAAILSAHRGPRCRLVGGGRATLRRNGRAAAPEPK